MYIYIDMDVDIDIDMDIDMDDISMDIDTKVDIPDQIKKTRLGVSRDYTFGGGVFKGPKGHNLKTWRSDLSRTFKMPKIVHPILPILSTLGYWIELRAQGVG